MEWREISMVSTFLVNWKKLNCLAGEFVHSYWQGRTFFVRGTKLNGSGALLDQSESSRLHIWDLQSTRNLK
jgi:hypothetical protein